MSLLLYRLGHLCARRHLLVIAIWVVAVAGVVAAARALGAQTSDNLTLPGTGSTAATDLLDDKLPKQANGTVPIVLESQRRTARPRRQRQGGEGDGQVARGDRRRCGPRSAR